MTPAELEKLAAWQAHASGLGAEAARRRRSSPEREPISTIEIVPRAPGIEGMTPAERAKARGVLQRGRRGNEAWKSKRIGARSHASSQRVYAVMIGSFITPADGVRRSARRSRPTCANRRTSIPHDYSFTQGINYWAVVGVIPTYRDDKDIYVYSVVRIGDPAAVFDRDQRDRLRGGRFQPQRLGDVLSKGDVREHIGFLQRVLEKRRCDLPDEFDEYPGSWEDRERAAT